MPYLLNILIKPIHDTQIFLVAFYYSNTYEFGKKKKLLFSTFIEETRNSRNSDIIRILSLWNEFVLALYLTLPNSFSFLLTSYTFPRFISHLWRTQRQTKRHFSWDDSLPKQPLSEQGSASLRLGVWHSIQVFWVTFHCFPHRISRQLNQKWCGVDWNRCSRVPTSQVVAEPAELTFVAHLFHL